MESEELKYWFAIVLLLAATCYIHILSRGEAASLGNAGLVSFPHQIAEWRGNDLPFDQEVRDELGVDEYLLRSYKDPQGRTLLLYVGYYHSQRKGKGIHSPKHCYPGAGWSLVERGVESVSGEGWKELVVAKLIFRKDNVFNIVLYWFQARGRVINNEYLQKLYMVFDAIVHNRTDGALVRVSALAQRDDITQILEMERQFMKEAYSDLAKSLSP